MSGEKGSSEFPSLSLSPTRGERTNFRMDEKVQYQGQINKY
jgi:hypothetical protein